MRIAFLGNRGVPANFGGSDTIFEQLGERLVTRDHKVVVYCRKHFSSTDEKYYKGIERVVLPSLNKFNFDTITHSFLSTLHVLLTDKVDVLNFHGIGNSFVLPLLIFSKKKSVVLIDGPDWKRPKWNIFAKFMLRLSVNFAIWFADEIIADNAPIHDWFKERFQKDTPLIYYGADFNKIPPGNNLSKWGLIGNDYILFVAMMVPDKGPDIILEAYSKLNTDKKLLMVGDTHYHKDYYYALKERYSDNPKVIFTGFQYGDAYREYMSNAYIYVHPFRSDGTSPSLLQSMALGNCIVANSAEETSAALEDGGILFEKDSPDSLAEKLQFLMDNPNLIIEYQSRSLSLAKRKYDWEEIVTQYENVFKNVIQPE
ncbi:MAG: glycosyltransferase family 4 protein [Bacteroidetes bacterium]|nr:glycosyltransferase family 4 protein [Bacteroidota bacterium]